MSAENAESPHGLTVETLEPCLLTEEDVEVLRQSIRARWGWGYATATTQVREIIVTWPRRSAEIFIAVELLRAAGVTGGRIALALRRLATQEPSGPVWRRNSPSPQVLQGEEEVNTLEKLEPGPIGEIQIRALQREWREALAEGLASGYRDAAKLTEELRSRLPFLEAQIALTLERGVSFDEILQMLSFWRTS
jgi:hypothetical protein